MKLILVMVTSLDGRSTNGKESGTHSWNSPEDQKHFQSVIENGKLLIMGSSTFAGALKNMQHRQGRLRVVLTRDPSQYDNEKIPGQLEFSNEDPQDLIQRLESQGFSEGYLLGGAHTNTEFLKQGLVTELWQTLEPKILGIGNGLVGEESLNVTLKLQEFEKLNEKGTLLLKYSIVY
jgi:dihydrofolate reductase